MSESGDPGTSPTTVRVEDMERALVLAREVAAATSGRGGANLRMEHLLALFANGNGPPSTARIQAALEAAGLRVDPSLRSGAETITLHVAKARAARPSAPRRAPAEQAAPADPRPDDAPVAEPGAKAPEAPRLSGLDAYQAASGKRRRPQPRPAAAAPAEPAAAEAAEPAPAPQGVSLADAQRLVDAEQARHNTAQSLAALLPATIVPVLAASFLGPLFGVSFAGLTLIASALLSRPGALASGKMGPIRMPAALARSFLLTTFVVALLALVTSIALIAGGAGDSEPADENTPIEQPQQTAPRPPAPRPAAPAPSTSQRERDAAAERRAERRRAERQRAERRRERRAAREREQEREQQQEQQQQAEPQQPEDTPPSGGGTEPIP